MSIALHLIELALVVAWLFALSRKVDQLHRRVYSLEECDPLANVPVQRDHIRAVLAMTDQEARAEMQRKGDRK